MALCVRKVESRLRWQPPSREEGAWLGVRELRADALRDLQTEDNTLSIYEVDEASGVSVSRILAALAANRMRVAKLDFVTFDSAAVEESGIAYERVDGETFDAAVNGHHLNLIQLTARKLAEFGARIRADGKVERRLDQHVMKLIRDSIDRKFLNPRRLNPIIAGEIAP